MRPPRPYQSRDVNAILAAIQRRQNPLYVLPTGGGKTDVFCRVVDTVVRHAGHHVGVFVHRDELLRQASDDLTLFSIAHGVIKPGHGVTSHHVHVASVDTVLARLRDGCRDTAAWLMRLDLAVFDEAHHAVADKWLRLIKAMTRAVLMGVTATPYRLDGRGLGDVFNAEVRGPTISQLIADGWLAPFAVYAPPTPLSLAGIKKLGGDWKKSDLQRVMDNDDLIRLGARWYAHLAPGKPALWFGTGIDHAAHAAAIYESEGWEAMSVDGGCTDAERRMGINALARRALQVLMSADLISEGVNVPVAHAAIFDRPTASTALFQQQAGRVSRPIWPNGFAPINASAAERKAAMARAGKPSSVLIDMVGNVATHGMPDEDRPWSLHAGCRGLEKAVIATRQCPVCYRVHRWAEACEGCGHRYPRHAARQTPGKELWRQRGACGLTADQIDSMPFQALLDLVGQASEADGDRIEEIKGYGKGWAGRVRAGVIQAAQERMRGAA